MLLFTLLIPFIAAIILLFIKNDKLANITAIVFSALTLGVVFYIAFNKIANFEAAILFRTGQEQDLFVLKRRPFLKVFASPALSIVVTLTAFLFGCIFPIQPLACRT